jgi:uncharacterized protein (DUF1330 family)
MQIQSNQCYISKEALAVLPFATKDSTRPVLQTMCIKDKKCYCADGYMLATANIEQGKDFPNCNIKIEDIAVAGQLREFGGVLLTKEEKMITIAGKFTIITQPVVANYPNVEHLLAIEAPEVKAHISLQVPLLKKLVDALTKGNYKYVALQIRSADSPIEFCVGVDESYKGLIMPYKMQNDMPWPSDEFGKIVKKKESETKKKTEDTTLKSI